MICTLSTLLKAYKPVFNHYKRLEKITELQMRETNKPGIFDVHFKVANLKI